MFYCLNRLWKMGVTVRRDVSGTGIYLLDPIPKRHCFGRWKLHVTTFEALLAAGLLRLVKSEYPFETYSYKEEP